MGRAFEYADGAGGRRRAAVIRAATGEDGRYLLAVVKLTPAGAFFASMYCTPRDAAFGRRTAGSGRCCHEEARISFRHFSGSGPLSIYWHDGPYGDAVEAVKGRGVAWLAPNGELLGVEFDDVARAADAQTLELPNGDVVTVRVKKGKVTVRQRHRARRTSAA